MPYLYYDQVEFDVIAGTVGDTFDRYAVRLNEIRGRAASSPRYWRSLPPGDDRSRTRKSRHLLAPGSTSPWRLLIHHFKNFTQGFEVPCRRGVLRPSSRPRGELGCYLVSDGTNKPYRLHVPRAELRQPSVAAGMHAGGSIADAIAITLVSRPGHGGGGPLIARRIERQRTSRGAEAIVASLPRNGGQRSSPCATSPRSEHGYLTEASRWRTSPSSSVCSPAEVRGTASFYDMLHIEPVGRLCLRRLHEHRLHVGRCLRSLSIARRATGSVSRVGQTTSRRVMFPRRGGRMPGRLRQGGLVCR